MENNIVEGFKLMIIGMSTVFVFLSLMIMVINLVARLTKKHAILELQQLEQNKLVRASKGKKGRGAAQRPSPTAIITAAVAAYEVDEKKQNDEDRSKGG